MFSGKIKSRREPRARTSFLKLTRCFDCRVNFKKNEKNYNAENSEVFKMVQEADKEPKTPEPG